MRVVPNPRESGTKRERTRNRLLVATQELLLERSAGSLSIRDVSYQAGLSHGTFYNYFESVDELLDNLALLFTFTHAELVQQLTEGLTDPAAVFALTTRQTLRLVVGSSDYGQLLFDAGLPLDHFARGLRMALRVDLERGLAQGAFKTNSLELTLSIVGGGVLGLALDLHRGSLPVTAIEEGCARLLQLLGVRAPTAARLAHAEAAFLPAPPLPLTWPRDAVAP